MAANINSNAGFTVRKTPAVKNTACIVYYDFLLHVALHSQIGQTSSTTFFLFTFKAHTNITADEFRLHTNRNNAHNSKEAHKQRCMKSPNSNTKITSNIHKIQENLNSQYALWLI